MAFTQEFLIAEGHMSELEIWKETCRVELDSFLPSGIDAPAKVNERV